MKKSTFLIITGIAILGCAYFESSPTYGSEAIRTAELSGNVDFTAPKQKTIVLPSNYNIVDENDVLRVSEASGDSIYLQVVEDIDYIINLNDRTEVSDPRTGEIIYSEEWDSKSGLAKAILKDNE